MTFREPADVDRGVTVCGVCGTRCGSQAANAALRDYDELMRTRLRSPWTIAENDRWHRERIELKHAAEKATRRHMRAAMVATGADVPRDSEGRIVGERADMLIVDDPFAPQQVDQTLAQRKAADWYTETLVTAMGRKL